MARDNDITRFVQTNAAASAGTTTTYFGVGERPWMFTGFDWEYESAEPNADNTIDIAISYTTDGTNFTALFTNANACGLLDTGAPLVDFVNIGNAAAGAGAGVAVVPTQARVPSGAVVKIVTVTAGTGTVPKNQVAASGRYI